MAPSSVPISCLLAQPIRARFDAGFALDFSEHIYDEQFLRIFRASTMR